MARTLSKSLIISLLLALTAVCAYFGYLLHENYKTDRQLKADYFTVNQIKYGLLSGNNWTWQVNAVLAARIDSFSVSGKDKAVLKKQVEDILHRMIDEANGMLRQKRDGIADKIKFGLINAFFDVSELRKEVPRFSAAIVDEIARSKHKQSLKKILKDKVSGFLNVTDQDSSGEKSRVLARYGFESVADFNLYIESRVEHIRHEQRNRGFVLSGVLLVILLSWIFIVRFPRVHAAAFMICILASFFALFIGVSLPMIEIDARISKLDLELMGSHITFYDQVIFYQAKSILDVIRILIVHGHADTVFVGILILSFSVLFPVIKLICTAIFLFRKTASNGFVKYMAFKSSKWSMADVMVIAIFMAYVGFKSILDNQLEDITMTTDTINVLTTNKTNLQTGFMVFVSFTLFNLMLGEILKRITRPGNTDHAGDPVL